MNGPEKSDLPIVAAKRANKAAQAAAEPVERRGGTKENVDQQSTVRTQSREAVSQAQACIGQAVTRNKREKPTALLHHINIAVLRAGFSAALSICRSTSWASNTCAPPRGLSRSSAC